MRYPIATLMFCTMFTMAAGHAQAQQAQFPLAAPAGQDSGARQVAPPGAVNQGPFFDSTWKYGTAFTPPAGAKIWNPAKLKLMQGGKLVQEVTITQFNYSSKFDPEIFQHLP